MPASATIYLDHNATTPLDPRVFEAMRPYFLDYFGNPSSVEHAAGLAAANGIQKARELFAHAIGAAPEEIVFTGSCTESDNLAILGVARSLSKPGHFITSAVEHPAVLEAFAQLAREGHTVSLVGVDETGRIRLNELEAAFRPDTMLVSVMGANNEVGTLQPLEEIASLCASRGVLFHSDLAQLPAYASVDVRKISLDLASFSGHKMYGPKGVGALYIRRRRPRIKLAPMQWGGGQETGLRPGTLNTPLIVGLGAAMELANEERAATRQHVLACTQRLHSQLMDQLERVLLNGHPTERLPNNLALSIEGMEPLALMRLLREDVAFSSSSACSTNSVKTSHVLVAMFGDGARARSAFRLSPGKHTTLLDIDRVAERICEGVRRLRRMS